jgi:hydroxymethylpyrimidine pyrophosphatase-like HAD family hydrolase
VERRRGVPLAHLKQAYDEVDLSAVVAFGDGRNDRCMLAMARVGVAVRGGHDDAAARAAMMSAPRRAVAAWSSV